MTDLLIRRLSIGFDSFILDKKAQNRSGKTIEAYQYHVGRFLAWLGSTADEGEALSPLIMRSYLVSMKSSGLSPHSIKSSYRHLRAFFSFCLTEGFLQEDPMKNVKAPSVDITDKPILTREDLRHLLGACRSSRDAAIVSCLVDTGCRASEFVRWDLQDVDVGSGSVIVMGKARRERTVFLGHRARRYLLRWIADGEILSGPIWIYQGDDSRYTGRALTPNGLRQVLTRLGARAGVDHCNPHAFRRTFAVECLKNGMDVFTLQRLMGHKSLDMLRHYLTLVTADLEDAHRSFAPMDRI